MNQADNYFNSIIAISVSKGGKVDWATAIPKRQVCRLPNPTGSIAVCAKGNNVYLLYNDQPENFEKKDDKFAKYTTPNGSEKVLVTLGPDGKYTKQRVGTNDKLGLRPACNALGGNKWVVLCSGDEQNFDKLKVFKVELK